MSMMAINIIVFISLSLLLGYGLGKVYDGIKLRRRFRKQQDAYITYLESKNTVLERSLNFYRLQKQLGEEK
jgi:hypothetical protein